MKNEKMTDYENKKYKHSDLDEQFYKYNPE